MTFFILLTCVTRSSFYSFASLALFTKKKKTMEWEKRRFFIYVVGLNISTGLRTMPGKKSSYDRRKLLDNVHSCPAWNSVFLLKVTSVLKLRNIRLACTFAALVFLFMKILINNLLTQSFFILKTVRYVWVY